MTLDPGQPPVTHAQRPIVPLNSTEASAEGTGAVVFLAEIREM